MIYNVLNVRIIILLYLVLSPVVLPAQKIGYDAKVLKSGKNGMVKLEKDVHFRQNTTDIYCDRADFNKSEQVLDAYGNVKIIQGEMVITGDFLHYDGNTKIGKLKKNITLIDNNKTLITDFLDFNTKDNSGYFYNGGEVIDSAITMLSQTGYYYPRKKLYIFKDSVIVYDEDYTMYSDTMHYDLITHTSYIFGPTEIIGDTTYLYCEYGWYDMANDKAHVSKNAFMKGRTRTLAGDSIFYDKKLHTGRAFNNVTLTDTSKNIVIKGNYGYYCQEPELAIVTDSAVFIQVYKGDSLFLHADTLTAHYDTSGVYRILKAYHRAKIFRRDIQAKADSIVYSFQDSVIRMYEEPVLWTEDNQVTARYIELHTKNNEPDFAIMKDWSFIISQEDSLHFNQVKGRNMRGYFRDRELYRIDVEANAQSLYFPEDDEVFIGMNKSESSKMRIYLKENKPSRIVFLSSPSGKLQPLEELQSSDLKLSDFIWHIQHRPLCKDDIFNWIEKVEITNEADDKDDGEDNDAESPDIISP